MLDSVLTASRSLEDYRCVVGDETIENLRTLAQPLQGARVLHVNSTPFGGGVAEILHALVPLMNDIGLSAEWRVIGGTPEFYDVTKAMHNNLQGMALDWTADMQNVWLSCNDANAGFYDRHYDYIVVHDPQPAGLLERIMRRTGTSPDGIWLWQCHIDTSESKPNVWDFMRPFIGLYKGAIFTREEYASGNLAMSPIFTVWPAIDPLSVKNRGMIPEEAAEVLAKCGLDNSRPILCQVSRYDPWKDPLGVIDVYHGVKQEVPELQLVMVGIMASDDPEGIEYYQRTLKHAESDPDIHILSNLTEVPVGPLEVCALQQTANVVIQKSIREGFGLTVTEALWKGKPVVAGNVGGIPLQVKHGETGLLASSNSEYVNHIVELLENPTLGEGLGSRGKEHVRQNFLTTRSLADYLRIFQAFNSGAIQSAAAAGDQNKGVSACAQ